MKVLLTSDWSPSVVNGVVSSVQTLRTQLEERGHDVRTLTLAPQSRSSQDEFGYQLASVGAGAIYTDARLGMPPTRRMLDEVVAWGPDVVHSQAEFSTFAWARRVAGDTRAPLVHTYHTMYEDYTHYFSPSRRLGRAVAAGFTRRVLTRTDRVVAPTQKVADLLAAYGVSTPVHVVPSGIDVHALRPAAGDAQRADDRARARALLGIGAHEQVLVYVGRLAREKELDAVMALVARYRAAGGPAPRLLVVGDGPEREQLHHEAARLGLDDAVVFAGAVPRDEVGRWYVAGDVFVSGSRSETQGLTYAEALACGLPVLCRADPCLDQLVADGVGGWQYNDDTEFAVLLDALLRDDVLRERTARAARRVAVEQCSAESFGARIEEVYDLALLDGARVPPRRRRRREAASGTYRAALAGIGTGPGVAWDGL